MMKYGVDISAHQQSDTVDRLVLGGKTDFIITRATVGTYTVDKKLPQFMDGVKKHGFKNSHYHAAYAGTVAEAVEEADFMVSVIEKFADKVAMPLFYDWEYFSAEYNKGRGINCDKALIQAMTIAFCERVKELGYKAGVYSNKDFCDRYYTPDFWAAHPDYYFWYARPGLNKPDKACYIWQYASNDGSEYGYPYPIDKNVLYGDFLENGGELPPAETMKPLSQEPCRLYIGFASAGDIKKIATNVEGLGISAAVADGYIITGLCSAGDQCYILVDCNALGVPCVIYKEPEKPTEPSEPTQPVDPPQEESKPEEPAPVPKPEDPTDGQEKTLMEVIKKIVKILYEFFYGE